MKIGYFTSIEGWGGSETYLLDLMKGIRGLGHEVVLFGIEGTRLWDEAGAAGIERIAWRKVESRKSKVEIATEDRRLKTEDRYGKTENRKQKVEIQTEDRRLKTED